MKIFPAIDIMDGKAVRLTKGDYAEKEVFSDDPSSVAKEFFLKGASCLHVVDLDGAKDSFPRNFDAVKRIREATKAFVEIGGGIRSMETVKAYLDIGIDRVILGTAAVTNPELLKNAVALYGDKIAVGADFKNGKIAVGGWLEESAVCLDDFLENVRKTGIQTVIVTDISKDGAMKGTNMELYEKLSSFPLDITASGGITSIEEIKKLSSLGIYGAILGKALYKGAIDLTEALKAGGDYAG